MNKNNQKGFTLILSLVLLLVMSLMGGSLIVISSSEHALIEAEKYLINQMIGPWPDTATSTSTGTEASAVSEVSRNTDASSPWPNGRGIPTNIINVSSTPCSNSFRNLLKDEDGNTLVAVHQTLWNFGELIEPILTQEEASDKEVDHMKRYRWEFFAINVGRSTFKGAGTSLKKTSTNAQRQGNAYRLYGCGFLMPKGTALTDINDPEILIPLETLVILSG
jgi:hypothetical protein